MIPPAPPPRFVRRAWLLLAAVAWLAGCAGLTKPWQAPEVALVGLRVQELGLARQVFAVTLAVRNPNDRTLPIKAMTYRLTLDGQELARGGGALERQIPAFGEALVEVEAAGSLLGLAARLPALALTESPVDWTLSGTATLAGGLAVLPYRYSGRIVPRELLSRALRSRGLGEPGATNRSASPNATQ